MTYTGKDLIAFGFEPGPHFGPLLTEANKMEAEGATRAIIANELLLVQKKLLDNIMAIEAAKPRLHSQARPWTNFLPAATNDAERLNEQLSVEHMDMLSRHPRFVAGALMPDAHPSGQAPGTIPVGGVVVLDNAISPDMHSADACCSMYLSYLSPRIDPIKLLDIASDVTHFGPHARTDPYMIRSGNKVWQHELPNLIGAMKGNWFTRPHIERAYNDFMTQGDGNHFISFGRSKHLNKTTILTHHGSRSLGAKVFKDGAEAARDYTSKNTRDLPDHMAFLPLDTVEGREYLAALRLVEAWTRLNHKAIHFAFYKMVNATCEQVIFNPHNFIFMDDAGLVSHAKGATPVMAQHLPHGRAIIPMNMAEPALVVAPSPQSPRMALGFAPHGAGRNMSRKVYKASVDDHAARYSEDVGSIDMRWYLGHPDLSECASAYKPAKAVIDVISDCNLAAIVDEIIPVGCMMAGSDTKEF